MGKTVRVDAAIRAELMAAFVRSEKRFAAAVGEGMEAWRAGELIEHDDVVAEFESRYSRA